MDDAWKETAVQLVSRYSDLVDPDIDPALILETFDEKNEPEENYHKFMAGRALILTDFYWRSLPHYMGLANAITYGRVTESVQAYAPIEACGWSVVEAILLVPDIDDAKFDHSILAYIKTRAIFENEFAFTLENFFPQSDKEFLRTLESPEMNNWLVMRIHNMRKGLEEELKKRGETLNARSLEDMKDRLKRLVPLDPIDPRKYTVS